MAKISGTLYCVFDGSDRILHTDSATLNVDVDLPETTNKESGGWEMHEIDGKRSWSIDFSGLYDETGSGITPDEILGKIIARTLDVTVYFKPTSGSTTGWTGAGKYKNIKIEATGEAPVKFSSQIIANGALSETT